MKKILFYLPAVTPWWFETIVVPMLRALHDEAELHVMVAPLWCNTGLEIEHVEPLADLADINWHIVTPDDPRQLRLDGKSVEGLLDLVHAIAPDITLARSADRITPGLFPGVVRYITEPGAEPVHAPHRWLVLDEQPFQHGVMPAHVAEPADHAAALMAPLWQTLESLYAEQYPGEPCARSSACPQTARFWPCHCNMSMPRISTAKARPSNMGRSSFRSCSRNSMSASCSPSPIIR